MSKQFYKISFSQRSLTVYTLNQEETQSNSPQTLVKRETFPLQNNIYQKSLSPVEIDSIKAELSKNLSTNYKQASSFDLLLSPLQTQNLLFKFPQMSEAELSEAIKFQAKKYLQEDVGDLALDLEIYEDATNQSDLFVILVASLPALTDRITSIFRSLGAEITGIESESSALLRFLVNEQKFSLKRGRDQNTHHLYIYFHQEYSCAILIDNLANPLLLNTTTLGFEHFVRAYIAQNPLSKHTELPGILASIGLETSHLAPYQNTIQQLQTFITSAQSAAQNLVPLGKINTYFLQAGPKIKNLEQYLSQFTALDQNFFEYFHSKLLPKSPELDYSLLPLVGNISENQ